MAKSQRKSSKARQPISSVLPVRSHLGDKAVVVFDVGKHAQAIVAQVLVHFGAGYGAERQNETPGEEPANAEIFSDPTVIANFYGMLLQSTIDHFFEVQWDAPPVRETVLKAAFTHGVLARQRVVADSSVTLNLIQILQTLVEVQEDFCPGVPGAGGGPICRF